MASLGGGALLDDKASHAWDHELASLAELGLSNAAQRVEAQLGLLAGKLSRGHEVVEQLRLREVRTLGGDGLDDDLRLDNLHLLGLDGLGGLLLGCALGLFRGLLDGLFGLAGFSLDGLLGRHGEIGVTRTRKLTCRFGIHGRDCMGT